MFVTLLFALIVEDTNGPRRMVDIRELPAAPSWTRLSRAAIRGVALTGSREFFLRLTDPYADRSCA
jgi:hypothetical protein